jgi:hypothetical protein
MRRALQLATWTAAAAVAASAGAVAAPTPATTTTSATTTLAPPHTVIGDPLIVAAGPGGRALITGNAPRGMPLVERTAGVGWRAARTISPREVYPLFAAWGPGRSTVVIAYDQRQNRVRKILALRRAPGAKRFAISTLAQAAIVEVIDAAADPRGDIAVLVRVGLRRVVLLTAARGGAFSEPRTIPRAHEAAVGVGGGRLVVASYDRTGVSVRAGSVRGTLATPQRLSSVLPPDGDVRAAVDAAGVATVAFVRRVPSDPLHRTALMAARAREGERFAAAAVVGRGGPPEMGAGLADIEIAAAGTTTALTWVPNDRSDLNPAGRLGIAVARAAGDFGPAAHPSAPALDSYDGPRAPALAVGAAGDVVLAYAYAGAVHATAWPAAGLGFAPPQVVSTRGHGGAPAVAVLADGSPLVAFHDARGAILATTRLDGT